jgi:hypothetical protein
MVQTKLLGKYSKIAAMVFAALTAGTYRQNNLIIETSLLVLLESPEFGEIGLSIFH